MDLMRISEIRMLANGASEEFVRSFDKTFSGLIDDLQNVLDKAHFCSEIHCVMKKN